MILRALITALALLVCSCASAGPWGHAPEYAPASGEERAVEGARDLDVVEAQRQPEEWTKTPVRFFGVVIKGKEGDPAVLEVGVRALAPRNLCDGPESESCRVTVTDKNFGVVKVSLQMTAEEKSTMSSGSLLRVVGMLERDPEGRLLVKAGWHRHWPRGYYVTESFRDEMRR